MPIPKAEKICLSEKEKLFLDKITASRTKSFSLVTRAKIILKSNSGLTNIRIADDLSLTDKTVRKWRRRWNNSKSKLNEIIDTAKDNKEIEEYIKKIFLDKPRSGSPSRITPEQRTQILSLACESPKKYGVPLSNWTIQELVNEIKKQKIVDTISWTRVQNFLKYRQFKTAQN